MTFLVVRMRAQVAMTAALLSTALPAQWAHAQAHSAITLGAYQYSLVDLDPSDGIGPSVTWGTGTLSQTLHAASSNGVGWGGGPNAIDGTQQDKTYPSAPGTAQSLSYKGFVVASLPDGSSNAVVDVPLGGTWYARATQIKDFTLSAHTAITFTAQASGSNGVFVPDWSVIKEPSGYLNNGYFDWAPLQASAKAQLYVSSEENQPYDFCSSGCLGGDVLWASKRTYATGTESQDKLLSVTITNNSQDALSSHLFSDVVLDGYATAPLMMVPETATWAQMALGLAGLSAMVGRARRRSKAS